MIPVYSILALVVVLFTGWIGSIVVSTNLLAGMITFHMLLAIVLVLILMLGYQRAYLKLKTNSLSYQTVPSKLIWILGIAFILMLVQVVFGTQVREQIDRISFALGDLLREEWIDRVGINFLIHRSFSLVILSVHVLYIIWAFRFSSRRSSIGKWSLILILVLIMEIASGIGMAYFGIPAFLQPIHLLLGCMLLGIQFWLILKLKESSFLAINSN
jgi:heme a synthase